MTPQGVPASKLANALIQDAASPLEDVALRGVGSAIRRARKRYGGLWVGGRVTLTTTTLGFSPNAVNRLAHYGDPSWTIPLSAVSQVGVEFGLFTKIVAVMWTGGVTRFRCYGAVAFADQIRAAALGSPSGP